VRRLTLPPLTNPTGRSHKIVCQDRGRPAPGPRRRPAPPL